MAARCTTRWRRRKSSRRTASESRSSTWRSLYPLDKELIGESIAKTHKAIVITEEVKRGGFGGEISAIIGEEFFDYLDAPVIRIGALDTPVPFAPNLEQYYIPNAQDILIAAKKMF